MRNRNIRLMIVIVIVLVGLGGFFVLKLKDKEKAAVSSLVTDKSAISLYHNWTINFEKELTNDDIQGMEIELYDANGKSYNCIWTTTADSKAIEIRPPVNGYNDGENYTLKIKSDVEFTLNGETATSKEISFTPKRDYEDVKAQFEDPNLESVIRDLVKKPDGEIFVSDLEGITILIANNSQIKSIAGIEYLVNLRELYLDVNEISDITPIKGLTYLNRLGLSYNNIKDISVLKGIPLRYLSLYGNEITDYSAVKDIYSDLEWKDFAID
ncbi:leucine-rich repeat domain-containing protein [Clostridium thermarum]|uniref:leucine-rich repeat domain-containing protein n=1 Tax=Clostridium thermarum TaxID=1716543 RepID=UPI0011202853|nr:leucine-rich repeat domain-containing protein [Clostridium thermarum]